MEKLDAEAFKQARQEAGFTIEQLAREASVSAGTVSMLESGTMSNPTVTTLAKIAKATKKPLAHFFRSNLQVVEGSAPAA